jgi:hypothetical protein
VEDLPFKFAVPCTATIDDSGGACGVSANALEPGSRARRRSRNLGARIGRAV